MKIAYAADLHAGNHRTMGGPVVASVNRRGNQTIDSLRASLEIASAHKCVAYVLLGDIFDTPRPEPQLITLVRDVLQRAGLRIYLLVGNHDQVSAAAGDHALGPLACDSVKIIERPSLEEIGSSRLLMLPFQSGKADDLIPAALQIASHRQIDVICFHAGIRSATTPPWLQSAPNSIDVKRLDKLCTDKRVSLAIAGDWHEHRMLGSTNAEIVQCGTLCPAGFDDAGLRGSIVVWDSNKRACKRYLVPSPVFMSFKSIDEAAQHRPKGVVYVRVQVSSTGALDKASALIEGWLANKQIIDGQATLNVRTRDEQIATAAIDAASADSVNAAVQAWIARMPIAECVKRAEVRERVASYLLGGRACSSS